MMTKTWSRCGTPLGTSRSCANTVPASVAASRHKIEAFFIISKSILFCVKSIGTSAGRGPEPVHLRRGLLVFLFSPRTVRGILGYLSAQHRHHRSNQTSDRY